MGLFKRFFYWIKNLFFPRKKKLFLSYRIKTRAERKLNKRIWQFKQRYNREPTKHELKWLVVNASHMVDKRKNNRGHWQRQRIRKVLLEERDIHYKMK